MKRTALLFAIALLAASASLLAQSTPFVSDSPETPAPAVNGGVTRPLSSSAKPTHITPLAPFSRMALGGGVSAMGINMQAAVNANRYMNLRATGNVFSYSVNNISTNGFNLNGKLNFATAGASVDFFPFPNHGFRLSPGALFYNQNAVSTTVTAAGGTAFTLNNVTYYASSTNPITGTGSLGLNAQNPAFTITTGWGNMISRRGGRWSFPFELGAAMIGVPTVNVALTSGQACDAQGQNCVNVATDPTVQANLQAQIAKYKNDLNPFRFYPIFSFGIGYNFSLRNGGATRVAAR